MKCLSKFYINAAFRETFMNLCTKFRICPHDLTLTIRILDEEQMIFQLCRQGKFNAEIKVTDLLNFKLTALRFAPSILEKIFRTVHKAFMLETGCKNPLQIYLIFYLSEKANCPCIGILQQETTLKALRIADIIEATELESEQLN